jgi:hypothetical protein
MNDNALNDAYVTALHHLIPVTLPYTMILDKSYVITNIKHARGRPGGINDMNPMGLREKIYFQMPRQSKEDVRESTDVHREVIRLREERETLIRNLTTLFTAGKQKLTELENEISKLR